MSNLLARLTGRRRNSRRTRPQAQQAFVPVSILRIPSQLPDSPTLQRKIISDINSLVETHISSTLPSNDEGHQHSPASPASPAPPSPEFVALQPRRRPPGRNDTPNNSQTLGSMTSEGSIEPESPLPPEPLSRNDRDTTRPVLTIPSPSSGGDNGWSTFGRTRARPTPSGDSPSGQLTSASRPNSQHRHRGGDTQSVTPTSTSPSSYTTPPTRIIDSHTDHAHTPSNHTFGKPTPPSSGFTFRSRHSSSPFPHRESVPPLPPLDHPAFLFPLPPALNDRPQRRFPSSEVLDKQGQEEERRPRPSTSLPILQPRDRTTSLSRLRRRSGLGEPRFRPRSRKTTLGNPAKIRPMDILPSMEILTGIQALAPSISAKAATAIMNPAANPDGRTRKRTASKSSKRSRNSSRNSSRRSSAEFSAMQASALGRKPGSESWETQVAMEMLRVSLGAAALGQITPVSGPVSVNEAKFGQARGNNVSVSSPPANSLELGSPFSLQDTHTHSSPNSLLHPPITDADYEKDKNDLERVGRTVSGIGTDDAIVMSHEDDTPTPSPTKGKEKERTLSNASSHSRRGPRRSLTNRRLSGTTLASIPAGPATADSSVMRPPVISLTGPTPAPSSNSLKPRQSGQVLHHQKSATEPLMSVLKNASTSPVVAPPLTQKSHSGGKRKLDEAGVDREITPPLKEHYRTTTFVVGPRPHRASERSAYSSLAPSSYHRKRARLSSDAKPTSRPNSKGEETNAANTGTWSSRSSMVIGRIPAVPPSPSRSTSNRHSRPPSSSQHGQAPSRRSISQVSQGSLPISALVSPHAPSVGRSSQYHMRDPRRPPPVQPTGWALSFPVAIADVEGQRQTTWALDGWVERGGSPLHAWLFFIGFLLFPVWWVASFMQIRKTRRLDAATGIGAQTGKAEKGTMLLDDPQLEHDANSWRTRCRIMAVVSLVTYIPFIILIAIFAP